MYVSRVFDRQTVREGTATGEDNMAVAISENNASLVLVIRLAEAGAGAQSQPDERELKVG